MDAFGSDAIPVHLLTREALDVYFDRLQPHGVIAFHISNNYLDLEPVLASLAEHRSPRLHCYVQDDEFVTAEQRAAGKFRSVWALLVREADDLPEPLRSSRWHPARKSQAVSEWTDHYSNIWQVFGAARE